MAGCTFEPATLGHHVESCIVTTHLKGLPESEEKGLATCLLHKHFNTKGVWPKVDRVKLAEAFRREGLVSCTRVGQALFERISAARYFERGVQICMDDPHTWLSRDYLAWKARVDQRREEIREQTCPQQTP